MDGKRFDTLARLLSATRSRRGVIGALLVGTLGRLGSDPQPAAAKTLKCKKIKNRKKRKKCLTKAKRTPNQPPVSPPPDPVTTADAACPAATTTAHGAQELYAQTFLAQRSGQLTSASVALFRNVAGANYDLEIRDVDQTGMPSTVLAGTTIIVNVPETTPTDPPRTITGTFGAPVTVVAGRRYALAVTRKEALGYQILVNENSPCPDSDLFLDTSANGTFTAQPPFDLVFATFVTA